MRRTRMGTVERSRSWYTRFMDPMHSSVLRDRYHLDSPAMPALPLRLSLTRMFLELSLYTPALTILTGVLATDDQEVEGWYLEGWCFFLMAEQAREAKTNVEGLSWEELARDARDCLETCELVSSLLLQVVM